MVQMPGLRTPFDTGTAAGIYDLRRLKIKLCAEPVGEARSALDFAFPSHKISRCPGILTSYRGFTNQKWV